MDDKNVKNQTVPISVVVALCAALGVLVYSQAPLKGIRPSVSEMQEHPQKIDARLWQDPFQAVLDQAKTKAIKPSGICKLHKPLLMEIRPLVSEIETHLQTENVTVLEVMVSGTPYAEEARIRQRYAVLSGLRRLSLFPKDPEHISFIGIFQSQAECEQAESQISLSTILPFEWFVSDNHTGAVLLLWMNDDVFDEKPLAKLAIFSELLTKSRAQGSPYGLKFKLIGPAGSKTLHEMLMELQAAADLRKWVGAPLGKLNMVAFVFGMDNSAPGYLDPFDIYSKLYALMETDAYSQLDGLEIYSAKATADDSFLLPGFTEEPKDRTNCKEKPEDPIAKKFSGWGITFQRTICPDNRLVQELIDELDRRGVIKGDHLEGDHIVLISEWDTLYGRSIPETFKKAWTADYEGKPEEIVHRFSYLRGIDGKLPGERDIAAKERKKTEGDRKEEENLQKLEEPMGRGQYDYLRRLAESIYELDQQLGPGSIKAIGVLGSDFYDKYLVLQALWQRFPDRIFFTTDLDARLLHPAGIKYTRNLVVASGFGLQLHKKFQGDVPPFRDVYQTSVYLATLRAFPSSDPVLQQKSPPNPRLFEIGRYNVIDLTEEKTAKTTDPDNDPKTVHPLRQMPELHAKPAFFITLIILLLLLFLWLLSNTVKELLKSLRQLVTKYPEILVLGLVALIVFYKFILQDPSEEPFSWTEGVSVWPTNILRLLAIGLSWFFIYTSIGKLKKNGLELWEEFCLGGSSNKSVMQQPPPWRDNLRSWRPTRALQYRKVRAWLGKCPSRISVLNKKRQETSLSEVKKWLCNLYGEIRCDQEPGDKQSRVRVNHAWEEYFVQERLSFRLKPIIPLVILYFAICGLVIIIFKWPNTPVRGVWSGRITLFILLCTIISFLTLTFFVFYNTSLCRRFVIRFQGKKPQWNLESLDQFRGRVGLGERELSEWMLIRLIAKRTEVVGKLIYYPFIVWFLIFASRLRYFDNWTTPIGLAIVIFMGALLAWYCAFMLRCAAEKLRGDVVERLTLGNLGAKLPSKEYAERLQDLKKEISAIQKGAFAPYLQNPLVHSLLVPLGGFGGVQLLDLLGKVT